MGLFGEKPPGGFGERLRREREMRGVGLEEISAATRISTRFLLALENDDWKQLPGGVFNRGFIRSVARYLGLDEEALLSEYALVTKDKPQVAVVAEPPAPIRGARWPWVAALALVILFAACWFGWQFAAPMIHAYRNPIPVAPQPAQPAPSEEAKAVLNPGGISPDANVLQLKVDVGQTTTVKVTADGRVVFEGRMKPGESKSFEAKSEFEINSANARTVVLEMNGQLMPAIGSDESSGTIKLGRKDLKKSDGGSH